LDELARRKVSATFFCQGENMMAYPQLVERIRSEGHTLAYHGFNHKRNSRRSLSEIKNDLQSAPDKLSKRYYRPPYGRLSWWKALAIPSDWKVIMWSWISYDFDHSLKVEEVISKAKKSIRPGDILVFHDNPKTKDRLKLLLPPLLDFVQSKGWKTCRID
jgi:peptidoglycan-N-acetylglucosamine deacetylase